MIREGFKGRAKLCANHDNAGRGAGHEEGGTRMPMGEQGIRESGCTRRAETRWRKRGLVLDPPLRSKAESDCATNTSGRRLFLRLGRCWRGLAVRRIFLRLQSRAY